MTIFKKSKLSTQALVLSGLLLIFMACGSGGESNSAPKNSESKQSFEIEKTEKEWHTLLTGAQYYILRQRGTELPFTGKYNHFKKTGTYHCAACDNSLFDSKTKFDSKTGWPSFFTSIKKGSKNHVLTRPDYLLGIKRTELLCSRCGSHLGHVFDDGPKPTGKRYCINSLALRFHKTQK